MSAEQQVWNIPYDKNPYFTGRERELTLLHDGFLMNRAASPLSQALIGEVGIGKTQIALEYAYRYREDYQAVFWIQADARELLATELMSIADQLKLPAWIGDNQEPVIDAVREWFSAQPGRWLLIVDQLGTVADLSVLQVFLPQNGKGDILITTQQPIPGTPHIVVEAMDEASGAYFLLLRSFEIVHGTPVQRVDPTMINEAKKVVARLGGHPLALEQAAELLAATRTDFSAYLERSQTLLSQPHPVATTWSSLFAHMEQRSPVAADLLRFCAFLAPVIPLELFFAPECPLELDEMIDAFGYFALATLQETESLPYVSSLIAHPAVDALGMYFLAHQEKRKNTFSLHPLVQSLLQERQDEQVQRDFAKRVVLAVSRLFPEEEFEVWEQCQRYLPQALACAALITRWQMDCPEAGFLLNETGAYLRARAQYATARPLLEQALALRERVLGADHPETAQTLSDLGHLARLQGRHTEARQFYQQALSIRERVLGTGRDTITALNDLGEEAQLLGEMTNARTLYQRARTLGEQVLGLADPETIRSQGNLAVIAELLGDDEQAEAAYQEALRLSEASRGPDSLGTAQALSRLALFYKKQGTSALAKALLERAKTITERKLGETHPDVAHLRKHLAQLEYEERGA
jgi:tetratricopeptide (TPR) repeat protein